MQCAVGLHRDHCHPLPGAGAQQPRAPRQGLAVPSPSLSPRTREDFRETTAKSTGGGGDPGQLLTGHLSEPVSSSAETG